MHEREDLVEGFLGRGFGGEVVEGHEGVDFGADADGDGFFAREEGVVFLFVDEGLLRADEVRGEEDVAAPGVQDGVEVGRGGRGEGGEGAWRWVVSALVGGCRGRGRGGYHVLAGGGRL